MQRYLKSTYPRQDDDLAVEVPCIASVKRCRRLFQWEKYHIRGDGGGNVAIALVGEPPKRGAQNWPARQ